MAGRSVPHVAYNHILSDPPSDIDALNASAAAINACTCTDAPETYELTAAQWHQSKVMGLAKCIATDRERGWATGETTWLHLRFHLADVDRYFVHADLAAAFAREQDAQRAAMLAALEAVREEFRKAGIIEGEPDATIIALLDAAIARAQLDQGHGAR